MSGEKLQMSGEVQNNFAYSAPKVPTFFLVNENNFVRVHKTLSKINHCGLVSQGLSALQHVIICNHFITFVWPVFIVKLVHKCVFILSGLDLKCK